MQIHFPKGTLILHSLAKCLSRIVIMLFIDLYRSCGCVALICFLSAAKQLRAAGRHASICFLCRAKYNITAQVAFASCALATGPLLFHCMTPQVSYFHEISTVLSCVCISTFSRLHCQSLTSNQQRFPSVKYEYMNRLHLVVCYVWLFLSA